MRLLNRMVLLLVLVGVTLFNGVALHPPLEKLLLSYKAVTAILLILTVSGFFYLWGFLFFHWGITTFVSQKSKILWFVALSVGGLLAWFGPLFYYFVVYELKRTTTDTTPI